MIVILLILTLLSINIGTIVVIDNNDKTADINRENFNLQADRIEEAILAHNKAVDVHVNETTESLDILLVNKEIQQPFLDAFNKHINATATAAPKVADNHELLMQVIEILQSQNTNTNNNNNNGTETRTTTPDNVTAPNSSNNTGSGG